MEQIVAFGSECIPVLMEILENNKPERILLVTGKNSYEKSGAKDFIRRCLSDKLIQIIRFLEFDNNPNIQDLKKGLELAKGFNPSLIIAIGGGSVMDMGKLIRFFHTHDGEILRGNNVRYKPNIPLVAVPTTAGTGSEATHFAVLYDETKTKHSIASPDILPEYAIINSTLTHGQSPYLTACAGFDALAQGIEAYWNKNATQESDKYAIKAIELLYQSLPSVVNQPTPELRERMSEGAYWAGKAINITKTTAPHAFSYPFTTHYGYAHGHAVALTFPWIAEYNFIKGHISLEKKIRLKSMLGLSAYDNVVNPLKSYVKQLGLKTLPYLYDVNKLAADINIERLYNNPANITSKEAIFIIKKATEIE